MVLSSHSFYEEMICFYGNHMKASHSDMTNNNNDLSSSPVTYPMQTLNAGLILETQERFRKYQYRSRVYSKQKARSPQSAQDMMLFLGWYPRYLLCIIYDIYCLWLGCTQRREGTLKESALSFYRVGPGDWIQIIRLGDKSLSSLSHSADSNIYLYWQ